MTTYALYNVGSGKIVNRIMIDNLAGWRAPDGFALIEETDTPFRIGGTYIGDVYEPPEAPPPSVVPPPPTLDEIYDQSMLTQRLLKALVLALNDGSLPIGTNKTGAQLKAIIKAKM